MSELTNVVNALIEQDGRILLLYTLRYQDYTLPGGKGDAYELMHSALKREAQEEIGAGISIGQEIGEYAYGSRDRRFMRHVYEAFITSGTPTIGEPNTFGGLAWVTAEEALALKLAPGIKAALEEYQKRLPQLVRPLEYGSGISLQEAEERYKEVVEGFKRVKSHYSGIFSRFKRNMSQEDQRALDFYTRVLLPLSLETSVQGQQTQQVLPSEDTLLNKISELSYQIMGYLSNSRNSGFTRLSLSCRDI